VREITAPQSFRTAQVSALFDVPISEKVRHAWQVDLPLDDAPWQIGLIVGPSGCGKSTIAQELWPDAYTRGYVWDDRSILDNFPAGMETRAIVAALTAVGFSSPPDWVKPYRVLSTGQQMRADLARALCQGGLVVFDEFTSVVDRTVAQIGSAALAMAIRRQPDRHFIAVTCHEDVLAWLAPDWMYEPATNSFQWRCLQRPPIALDITRCHSSAWRLFQAAHYLSATLNPSALCYVAEWAGVPVGFTAVLPVIGFKNAYRESRTVILPDFQGIGIGTHLSDTIAAHYHAQGKRYRSTTSHPAMIAHRNHSTHWSLCSVAIHGNPMHSHRVAVVSTKRSVATFEYIGS